MQSETIYSFQTSFNIFPFNSFKIFRASCERSNFRINQLDEFVGVHGACPSHFMVTYALPAVPGALVVYTFITTPPLALACHVWSPESP
jgi:hypothetical protein